MNFTERVTLLEMVRNYLIILAFGDFYLRQILIRKGRLTSDMVLFEADKCRLLQSIIDMNLKFQEKL